jgi:hypothetical protein
MGWLLHIIFRRIWKGRKREVGDVEFIMLADRQGGIEVLECLHMCIRGVLLAQGQHCNENITITERFSFHLLAQYDSFTWSGVFVHGFLVQFSYSTLFKIFKSAALLLRGYLFRAF